MAKTDAAAKPGKDNKARRRARDYGVGLPARRAAAGLLQAVLRDNQPLDEALLHSPAARLMDSMAVRDRALARAIASTSLRRKGQIEDVLQHFLDKQPPRKAGALREILLAGACQILFLDTPGHAAIDLAVTLAKQSRKSAPFAKLVNAVLRRVAEKGPEIVAEQNAAQLNTPEWLWSKWCTAYGEVTARKIAEAHLHEATLDLSVKEAPSDWASRLGGIVLPTGSVRLAAGGRVDALEGFEDGTWWVQDAAAAIPARLLGDVRGRDVADLCAAPGGKTAQLAAAGANVTAVDSSEKRLERLRENLGRLKLTAAIVNEDVTTWRPSEKFDAVLLDAPCSGTGTLRRHPDIAHLKTAKDITELCTLQEKLLSHAAALVKPGGSLLYCTCSLEPEEGENQIARFLEDTPHFTYDPIRAGEAGVQAEWLNGAGQLRTLPYMMDTGDTNLNGMDGFFAARLRADT